MLPEGLLGASDPGGVMIRPPDYEPFKLRQRATIKTGMADAIVALAKTQIGKPFDGAALHAFLHPDHPQTQSRDWRNVAAWFCAELHTWTCETLGFWPYRLLVSPNLVAPADLLLLLNPYLDVDAWRASRIETSA